MSTTETAKIVIEGETNGATTALKETSRATDGVTTAAKAAGAQLADLTKQAQATARASDDAAKATQRRKQAEDEATMTARAFGAASKEAADAQARLTRALEAEKTATQAAAAELQQLKLGLAATNASTDKMTPALARVTKETEKLSAAAERQAAELKKAELAQVANARAAKQGGDGFDVMGAAAGRLASALAPAALGGALVGAAAWIGENAQATLQFETAIQNLPFSLDGAKAATHGLIAEQALMAAASSATSLKVVKSSADFEKLAEASVKLGAKLGQPADALLNNLVTALGRGSTELLDNAGVVLKTAEAQDRYAASIGKTAKDLTDAQKADAFKIEAFKAITAAADQTTIAVDSNAAAVVRYKNAADETWASVERGAVNAAGAVLTLTESAVGAVTMSELYAQRAAEAEAATERWAQRTPALAAALGQLAAEAVLGADALEMVQRVALDEKNVSAAKQLAAAEHERLDAIKQEADFAERQQRAFEKIAKDHEAFLDAQAMDSIVYGPDPAPKSDKKKGRGKKKADGLTLEQRTYDVALARTGDGRDVTDAISLDAQLGESARASAAEAAGIEAATQARRDAISAIDLEIEARTAAGMTFDDLTARRMAAEKDLYDFTRASTQDKARLADAETRYQKTQHDKRLRDLRAAYAAEQKEQQKREAHMAIMATHVEGFGSAVVGAMEAEAEGSKGAVAKSLQAWLAGVRNQMAVKAVVELALGAASAASLNPVGAAAHFTAAGLATAAAAAAGIAAAAVGAAIPADAGGGAGGGGGSVGGGGVVGGGAGPAPGASSGGTGGGGGNERQDTPVSFREMRALDAPRQQPAANVTTQTVTHVHVTGLVVGDEARLGAEITRLAERGRRHGRR